MRSKLSLILAGLCACVALVGSVAYGLSGAGEGVLRAMLFLFALCGLLTLAAALLLHNRFSKTRLAFACTVCGTLIAMIPVTVMSFAPMAAAAAVCCMVGILVSYESKGGFIWTYVIALTISSTAAFALLLMLVTSVGVDMVETPPTSEITRSLEGAEYIDAFRIEPSMDGSPQVLALFDGFVFSMQPWWPRAPKPFAYAGSQIEPGSAFGLWKVHLKTDNELILGLDRSYINLRLSLFGDLVDGRPVVIATTAAKYNNWKGDVYFRLVRFGHKIVLADTMRRMKIYLEEEAESSGEASLHG